MAVKLDEARIKLLKMLGNVEPSTNNSFNLGTSSYKWANVYATTFNGALSGNASTATLATKATALRRHDGNATATLQYSNANQTSYGWGLILNDANGKKAYLYFTSTKDAEAPSLAVYGADATTSATILSTKNTVTVAQGGTGKTSFTTNYVLMGNGSSAIKTENAHFNYVAGTTSTKGYEEFVLGNSTASGTAGNRFGRLALYSSSSAGVYLVAADTTSWSYTNTLPAVSGTLLNSGNYNSYAPTLTGTGASGSWGISVTGSSGSCTGNAATATAIKTAGTTAQFYRGDNTWSNMIKPTAHTQLGIDTDLKIGTARKDLNFDIGNGTGTGINDGYAGGITWGNGTAAYAGIYYQSSGNYGSRLLFATTSSYANGAYARMIIQSNGNVGIGTLSPTYKLSVSGDISATNFRGALIGNVTGNVSGSSGSCTGNAATATKLATARAINGTNFDGSAAITTANWGTARTISISSTAGTTGTSINGSGNASLVIPSTMTGFSSITSTSFKASSGIYYGRNTSLPLLVPDGGDFYYGNVDPSSASNNDVFRKGAIKLLCANNPGFNGVLIGRYHPNSHGILVGDIYSTSVVDSTTGLPRYSTFWASNLVGEITIFGTNDYNYYERIVLDSSNYTSYTVKKDGTGASGNWGINITGRAYTIKDSYSDNTITLTYSKAGQSSTSWLASWNGYELGAIAPGNITAGKATLLALHNTVTSTTTRSVSASSWNGAISGVNYMWGQSFKDTAIGTDTGDIVLAVRAGQYTSGGTELCVAIDGDYYSMGNKVLHAGNYSSYAVPITGGTMTGQLIISTSSRYVALSCQNVSFAHYQTNSDIGHWFNKPVYVQGDIYGGSSYNKRVWMAGDLVTGAVWNDYAEYRRAETIEPGRVVQESKDGIMKITTERMVGGCEIISDTFGFAIGETDECKTPIAATGRVLAYPYEDRETFELGQAVCAGPGGTVSRMSRNEIIHFPDRIIGTVSEIPDYETWGTGNVKVNGRIWIRIR